METAAGSQALSQRNDCQRNGKATTGQVADSGFKDQETSNIEDDGPKTVVGQFDFDSFDVTGATGSTAFWACTACIHPIMWHGFGC